MWSNQQDQAHKGKWGSQSTKGIGANSTEQQMRPGRKGLNVVLTTRDNAVDPDQTSANRAWPQAGYMSGNHSDLTHTQESKLPHSVKSSSVADTHAEFADTHLTMTSTEVTS